MNANWNVDNLTVVAFINNHDASNVNNRAILNANAKKVNDLSLGISDNNESRTTVYPNPATDVLNVLSENAIRQVEIYNAQGQLVKASDGNVESISISNLTEGLYFVKVITDNGTSTHKIVKK